MTYSCRVPTKRTVLAKRGPKVPAKPKLVNDANKLLRFLRSQELLGPQHALTVALLKEACKRLSTVELASQAAQLSHEIRQIIDMLPKPAEKPKPTPATDFMAELAALEESVGQS